MRQKTLQCVIAFKNTTDAMAFEKIAKCEGFTGRIIPVPVSITAGCGLAWREDIANKESLLELLNERHLKYDGVHELVI
jgi:hypothetical protein